VLVKLKQCSAFDEKVKIVEKNIFEATQIRKLPIKYEQFYGELIQHTKIKFTNSYA